MGRKVKTREVVTKNNSPCKIYIKKKKRKEERKREKKMQSHVFLKFFTQTPC